MRQYQQNETLVLQPVQVSDADVHAAQIEMILSTHVRSVIIASIMAPICIALLVHQYVPLVTHYYWLWICVVILLARSVIAVAAQRTFAKNIRLCSLLIYSSLLLSALNWSIAIMIYWWPTQSFEVLIYIIFVLMAILSGTTINFSIKLAAFYCYFAGSLLPVMAILYFSGEEQPFRMFLALAIYIIGMLFFVRRYAFKVREQLELRLTNEHLMEQFRQEKELAQQAQQAKSRFLAAASHDLRQPLHAINMFFSLLQRKLAGGYVDLTGPIDKSLKDLSTLLNALLDTSRLDSGELQVNQEKVDLSELLGSLATEMRSQAKEKNLSFRAHIREFMIESDPVLLSSVIRNLLENAVKYTRDGGVLLSCRRHANAIRIQVWDTGVGIDEENQALIFREFIQLENPARDRSKGVGLGLANASKIAELLDYKLMLSSAPGKGSVFTLEIPDSAVLNADNFIPLTEVKSKHASELLSGIQVLLIEDEDTVLLATKMSLEYLGAVVYPALNREEAIKVVKAKSLDIIVTDYRLGGQLTGLDLAVQLNQIWELDVPIIVVSGEMQASLQEEVLRHRAWFMSKPLEADQLAAKIRQCLQLDKR